MREIWKDVPDYEGHFQVSNMGRVRSMPYFDKAGNERRLRYRTPRPNAYGYLRVTFFSGKSESVHRLVMAAFFGESEMTVDHINGIKTDNRLSNLRYMSRRENICDHWGKEPPRHKGTHYRKDCKKWCAILSANGKAHKIGNFCSEIEAAKAYEEARHRFEVYGELPKKREPKGFYYDRRSGKFVSEKIISGKKYWIGSFDSPDQAAKAYREFKPCS